MGNKNDANLNGRLSMTSKLLAKAHFKASSNPWWTVAEEVERMVLDAEIKGLQYGRDYQPFVIDKRLEELRAERDLI